MEPCDICSAPACIADGIVGASLCDSPHCLDVAWDRALANPTADLLDGAEKDHTEPWPCVMRWVPPTQGESR